MKRIALGLLLLSLLVLPITPPEPPPAEVQAGVVTIDFLDVGQGDAILIRCDGKASLIDAGPSKGIVKQLKETGVTSLDLVVVTHHHADHYGGMDDVIREFHPRFFLATDSAHTTPVYLKLLTLVRDEEIHAIFPTDRPRKVELGSAVLTVLPQPPEDKGDENDNSIGIRLQVGGFAALLTGDSEAGERTYWERNCPELIRDVTVLKLAHHGSRNGTDARWLDRVRPQLAVASLGAGNEYGHPHPQTLELLERRGIPLLRTDRDGTIEIISDGKSWEIRRGRAFVRGPPPEDRPATRTKAGHREPPRDQVRRVDLNMATRAELESLPGVGKAMAERIIEARPFASVDDLSRVKGIGVKRLEEIRNLVRVR